MENTPIEAASIDTTTINTATIGNTFDDTASNINVRGRQDRPGWGSTPPQDAQLSAITSTRLEKILIVDDEPINIKVVRKYLANEGYADFLTTTCPEEVVDLVEHQHPDVVLLDVVMPRINGLEILRRLRSREHLLHIPVLILTASDDQKTKIEALQIGATDFLAKPVNPTELVPRVRNALVLKAHHDHLRQHAETLEHQVKQRTAQLAASRLELIHCLARAAEYRDNETGRHVIRVGRYVGIIAQQLGLPEETVELYEHAAPLHDMGKMGIPDAILLKPGALTPEEFEVMQKHCSFGKHTFEPMSHEEWSSFRSHTFLGEEILNVTTSPIIEVAATIALTHHERWDGKGYPLGLAGEDIPLEGRITAVADVFDALSSKRPYKPALPLEKCFSILREGRGTQFDPRVLDAFFARREEIVRTKIECADID